MIKNIVISFDGVIHSFTSGWQGIDNIPDAPVAGAIQFLRDLDADNRFDLSIFSAARSADADGVQAMSRWLYDNGLEEDIIQRINFARTRPPSFLSIDARCLLFVGAFPALNDVDAFATWNA